MKIRQTEYETQFREHHKSNDYNSLYLDIDGVEYEAMFSLSIKFKDQLPVWDFQEFGKNRSIITCHSIDRSVPQKRIDLALKDLPADILANLIGDLEKYLELNDEQIRAYFGNEISQESRING